MADDECEIEYLDEDEDLIQQYVLAGQKHDDTPTANTEESTTDCEDSDELDATIASLVKKREIETKKKAIKPVTDSEYDPIDDQKAEESEEIAKKPKKRALKHETDSEYDPKDDQIAEETEEIAKKPKKRALTHETDSEYDPTEDQIAKETAKKSKKRALKHETDSEYDPKDDQIAEEIEEIAKKPKKRAIKHDTDSEYNPKDDQIAEETEAITKKPKKKFIKHETDSEYDPTEDQIAEESEEEITEKITIKRPQIQNKKHKPAKTDLYLDIPVKDMRAKQIELEITPKTVEYNERKKFKIRIPDFEDPLCLPVRAIKKEEIDVKKLNIWNKVCLEQFKKNDLAQINNNKPRIVRSCKTAMFRNVQHLGTIETMACFRTRTQNEIGERRSESCQSMLPKFREKRGWHQFDMVKQYPRKIKHRNEVLLTKEKHSNEDVLVVYKPGDSTSTVMKMVEEHRGEDIPPRKVLEQIVLTRMCAPCYQMSSRCLNKEKKPELSCKICNRTFLSVYSMLTHLKTYHKDEHVRQFKEDLSRTIAKAVNYHYKCRVCQLNCTSVMQLRKHVVTHKEWL